MAHFRPVRNLSFCIALALLAAACGGTSQQATTLIQRPQLDVDGIGISVVGDPPQAVIDELTAVFGAPDRDSGWTAADSPLYGTCPGVALRAVGWGSLFLFFSADDEVAADNEHVVARFYSYSYGFDFARNEGASDPRGLQLTTTSGIGLASTRSELRSAYGADLVEAYNEDEDVWTWSVGSTSSDYLRGLLDGPGDEALVNLIERVPGCSIP
ncbi:MAG: hypothetical protein OEP52_05470 [Acidimicrobiia bacterium]|nr:hypothetical protein [Acidimicrobiia bacterium]